MFWAILAVKAASAALTLAGRLKKAGAFLLTSLASDLIRKAFLLAREGLPKPYVGRGFLLWLPDPAMVLLLPSVLLGAVFGWWVGATVWAVAFLAVSLSYPSVRGDDLLRVYWAFHGAAYSAITIRIFARAVRDRIRMEEALLLLFALAGLGGIVLVKIFGTADWWGVWAINFAAYVSAGFVGVLERRSPGRKA